MSRTLEKAPGGSKLDGLIRTWAQLSPESHDSWRSPIHLARPPAEVVACAARLSAGLPRWWVLSADSAAGILQATHKTLVWRFSDDILLKFEPEGSGSRVVGRGQSRIGKGDLPERLQSARWWQR